MIATNFLFEKKAKRTTTNQTKTKPVPRHSQKKQRILADFKIAYESRLVSNLARKEVLNGRAKFGLESSGKELLQLAMAHHFQKGDFFSGYYRDQTFMMKLGIANPTALFSALYADMDNDKFSGGRQMNNHFATPMLDEQGNWLAQTENYNIASPLAPLAGQLPHALGLALASKKFRATNTPNENLSINGNEVSFAILGDATTSEGIFFETVNAACVMQVPMIFVIQDDGYGISVPQELQTAKGNISTVLQGFQREFKGEKACEIYRVKAYEYEKLYKIFEKAVSTTRQEHVPAIIHITECTQQNGHSTSGSHERYKPKARLEWEKKMDCLVQFEAWMLKHNWATQEELNQIKTTKANTVKTGKKLAWQQFQAPFKAMKKELIDLLKTLILANPANEKLNAIYKELVNLLHGNKSDILETAQKVLLVLGTQKPTKIADLLNWWQLNNHDLVSQYQSNLYSTTAEAAINAPVIPAVFTADSPMKNGYEILNKYFDQLFGANDKVYAFGQDVGKIGGVNQAFAGLQKKYGENRVFDAGIREWTIVGQAIGMAMRGLRPIGEIQYLDYLVYALPALTDDLATLRWRSNGQQKAPAIIRTRGHRLEGIWHSGSPMGMLLGSLRGMYLCTPRNMTQAAGMYNTLLQSDDPAIVIEPLNGYRKKEQLPDNLKDFTVPLGVPEVLHEGSNITLVTYGACVSIAQEAAEVLANYNISLEVLDVQTLLPFDLEHRILESIKKTNRVIFMDEDVPGGGTSFMMQKVLEEQEGYQFLDAQPVTIAATEHRTPYGDNGNYVTKPEVFDVVKVALNMMKEAEPGVYGAFGLAV